MEASRDLHLSPDLHQVAIHKDHKAIHKDHREPDIQVQVMNHQMYIIQ